MAKTSVKKYKAMRATAGKRSRICGLFQYYGANRTGRWAGRYVQVQNLPQNHLEDLDLARRVVKSGDFDLVKLLYGNVPDTLSQLIRTAFIPEPGKTLIAADFAAIELIVIAWLAGEKWVIDEFTGKRKIYEATAARMLGVSVDQIKKGSSERQKGKIASLACQYGGGVGALISMGALRMGLVESELQTIVDQWRDANPRICKLWRDVERAARAALTGGDSVKLGNLTFSYTNGALFIELPSGRRLSYIRTRVDDRNKITYMGVDQNTKKWARIETWGGKLVENIVQAIARDCLAVALLRLDDAGHTTVGHVHDEIILEGAEDQLDEVLRLMTEPIPWAPGLPLAAEGFTNSYYKK
jgi:DNA polymerase